YYFFGKLGQALVLLSQNSIYSLNSDFGTLPKLIKGCDTVHYIQSINCPLYQEGIKGCVQSFTSSYTQK
ncbi:MAG: hypothetical protein ACPGKZ_06760, partial [Flavobacteriaceae bacterium]